MNIGNLFLICLLLTGFFTAPAEGQIDPERQWPSYRGYLSGGVLDNANLPEMFDPSGRV